MSEKRKAPTTAATVNGAKVKSNNNKIIVYKTHNAVKRAQMVDRVRALIPKGRRRAIHVRDIENITGFSDREIRKAIETLRIRGDHICGDDAGLYYPENIEELRAWEKHRTATARAIYRTTAAARRTLKKYNDPDQLTLDDMGLL